MEKTAEEIKDIACSLWTWHRCQWLCSSTFTWLPLLEMGVSWVPLSFGSHNWEVQSCYRHSQMKTLKIVVFFHYFPFTCVVSEGFSQRCPHSRFFPESSGLSSKKVWFGQCPLPHQGLKGSSWLYWGHGPARVKTVEKCFCKENWHAVIRTGRMDLGSM